MIIRIVRLSFDPVHVQDFIRHFETHREAIASFEGCLHLEAWRDVDHPNVFYTYSHWQDTDALERYRKSSLFQGIWQQTKQWFNDKPIAHSVQKFGPNSLS